MKRVRVIAAALPAAVGLAFPTLAQAAASYGPDCSFPTGTWVYGWTSYHRPASQLMVEIYGSGFTGKHQCA
jgi:hypothetical protein